MLILIFYKGEESLIIVSKIISKLASVIIYSWNSIYICSLFIHINIEELSWDIINPSELETVFIYITLTRSNILNLMRPYIMSVSFKDKNNNFIKFLNHRDNQLSLT